MNLFNHLLRLHGRDKLFYYWKWRSQIWTGLWNQILFQIILFGDLQEKEREFNTKITIEVLGHLVGKGLNSNENQPEIAERETTVQVELSREYIWTDPENEKYKKIW